MRWVGGISIQKETKKTKGGDITERDELEKHASENVSPVVNDHKRS